ncbi:unnamed protein product [Vitrella brassicaformis CCMP3155]|uniref:USP domain-containing protein n=2 Tax=Vitrella brassicaformis TaxID=1169539 RepID=A0A0G4EKH8_VITBC|nr:unnamed protein product [Vitrella brassicaformis CCMP3155]|eukprot:CEL97950.1 unnamed protein product [Vitrella brassicaformis CCMP3155]
MSESASASAAAAAGASDAPPAKRIKVRAPQRSHDYSPPIKRETDDEADVTVTGSNNAQSTASVKVEAEEDKKDIVKKEQRGGGKRAPRVRPQRRTCPYLGTVNRHLLDFDFEKLCSITLSNLHVYCCLVCGKYFQGRGKNTHSYTHALEEGHYVYINLSDCNVYCLPENYLVEDASLNDIKYNLKPTYTPDEVKDLSSKRFVYGKALDGTDFIPGCIGLNDLKRTDYCNVVVQFLCQVIPLRNALLLLDLSHKQRPDPVLLNCSELLRKIFNPRNFKGIVSPHEFMQAVGVASEKKFRIGQQEDPLTFFVWLMNRLHAKLKDKQTGSSVVHQCFQGDVFVKTSDVNADESVKPPEESKTPFLYLTLEVPPSPIFKDSLDRNMIPTVPIFDLLQKFDGETRHETMRGQVKRYSLWRLPPYLVFHIKRFSKNNFFLEKNPTIVTFPVKNLDLREYVHPEAQEENPVTRYDLIANVCHEGKPHDGKYRAHVLHAPSNQWYEMEDLRVTAVLPQLVALSESYVQVYQRQDVLPDGTLDQDMRKQAMDTLLRGAGGAGGAEDDVDMFAS